MKTHANVAFDGIRETFGDPQQQWLGVKRAVNVDWTIWASKNYSVVQIPYITSIMLYKLWQNCQLKEYKYDCLTIPVTFCLSNVWKQFVVVKYD